MFWKSCAYLLCPENVATEIRFDMKLDTDVSRYLSIVSNRDLVYRGDAIPAPPL
jgi:hypothetical protein